MVMDVVVRAIRDRLTSPEDLCGTLGLEIAPKRVRDGVFVRCPWHEERTASCSVRVIDGTIGVYCHGCHTGGDALSLIAAVHGLHPRFDFPRVLRRGAELAGVDMTEVPKPRRKKRVARVDRLAQRIDDAAEAWLRGRPVRRDVTLETAPIRHIARAFELLAEADRFEAEEAARIDAELDRLADEWIARNADGR